MAEPDGGTVTSTPETNLLDAWIDTVRREFGIDAPIDRNLVLDVARDVAHGVARPAAPITAYLMGLAVANGADPADAAARLSRLAAERAGSGPSG